MKNKKRFAVGTKVRILLPGINGVVTFAGVVSGLLLAVPYLG